MKDSVGYPVIQVIRPGVLTTVQDAGRFGLQNLGVSPCGAMDGLALRVANQLVENAEEAACLEVTLPGVELEILSECELGIAGADLDARLDNLRTGCWTNVFPKTGQRLTFHHRLWGARTYLSVRGGFFTDKVLGSSATDLKSGWGGLSGRRAQKGDRLHAAAKPLPGNRVRRAVHPGVVMAYRNPFSLRAMAGPQIDCLSSDDQIEFFTREFRIGSQSGRMAYLLSGPRFKTLAAEIISDAVPFGAVQIFPNGQVALIMADRQTVGGYPKVAVVISADLPKAGQLCAGHRIRFCRVSLDEAHDALKIQQQRVARGALRQ